MDEIDNRPLIPIPTVKRFPSYLRILKQNKAAGMTYISATTLAEELGLKPIQVRKDISCTGIEGKPKVGFEIVELIDSITHVLGWDNSSDALIVGAGNMGKALAQYQGFENYGLKIVAIFDKNPEKIGQKCGNLTILPIDSINQYIKMHRIAIAVITVPASSAQSVADLLVKCGIRAIWNFAPKDLKLPEEVVMQRTDLATSFAVLSIKLKKKYGALAENEYNDEEI